MTFGESDHLTNGSQTSDLLQSWLWALSVINNIGKKSHDTQDMSLEKRTYHVRSSCSPTTRRGFTVSNTSKEM